MKKYIIGALAALILLPAAANAKTAKQGNVQDLKYSIEDKKPIFPDSLDYKSYKMEENWYLKNYTTVGNNTSKTTDPGASDEVMRQRLADLPTVIEMPYNSIVKSYIERYTKKGRVQLSYLLGLSLYYMPIFEQELERAGLPMELKYLPVIESSLNPAATSKSGAAGLWQFIVKAAKGYDMEVNSLVDERRDPYISSERACRLLKDLYNTYGDWSLAIAAYNCGPGTVNKALQRAGGDTKSHDFWSIYYFLPAETRGYVPFFIAANYFMEYYVEHGISPVLNTKPLVTDTIHINNRVHFNQIAQVLDIPIEEIRILNPQFRTDVIPGTPQKSYNLILPSQQIHAYIVSEEEILNFDRDKYARRTDAEPGQKSKSASDSSVGDEVAVIEETVSEMDESWDPEEIQPVAQQNPSAQNVSMTEPEQQSSAPRRRRGGNNSNGNTTADTSATSQTSYADARNKSTDNRSQQNSSSTKSSTSTSTKSNSQSTASTTKKQETKKQETKKQETASTTKKQDNKKTDTKKQDTKKTDTKKTDTKQKSTTTSYTVQKGDNLTTIAKKNGTTVEELRKANPNLKGDMVKAGEKINVPSKSGSTSTASKSKSTNTASNSKNNNKKDNSSTQKSSSKSSSSSYTVQSGDNLTTIAKKNGTTVEELRKANPNLKGDMVKAGEKINMPSKKSSSSSKSNSKSKSTTDNSKKKKK